MINWLLGILPAEYLSVLADLNHLRKQIRKNLSSAQLH